MMGNAGRERQWSGFYSMWLVEYDYPCQVHHQVGMATLPTKIEKKKSQISLKWEVLALIARFLILRLLEVLSMVRTFFWGGAMMNVITNQVRWQTSPMDWRFEVLQQTVWGRFTNHTEFSCTMAKPAFYVFHTSISMSAQHVHVTHVKAVPRSQLGVVGEEEEESSGLNC